MRPVSAQESGAARSGLEQQGPGSPDAAALRYGRQHRRLDGRRGRAVRPRRPRGASVRLPHRNAVPEDPPGGQVSVCVWMHEVMLTKENVYFKHSLC